MKLKTIIVTGLIIVTIPNLPVINKYIAHKIDEGYFRCANLDGSFTMTQGFSFKSIGSSILAMSLIFLATS